MVAKNRHQPLLSLWFLSHIAMGDVQMSSSLTRAQQENVPVITAELSPGPSQRFPFWGAVIARRLGRKLYQGYCSKGASVIKKQHIRACPHRKGIISNQQGYNAIGCCSLHAERKHRRTFFSFVFGSQSFKRALVPLCLTVWLLQTLLCFLNRT